ncbi:Uncharacterised protein [Budvicia aquatica]|uniref:Uncharacterized protein n=1 Tax=Budvicia aquatica TaxID=82979 RepID=A0A484ZC49_9GAMM|nr:Uncharacterised protein [Budvicia aquatica]
MHINIFDINHMFSYSLVINGLIKLLLLYVIIILSESAI